MPSGIQEWTGAGRTEEGCSRTSWEVELRLPLLSRRLEGEARCEAPVDVLTNGDGGPIGEVPEVGPVTVNDMGEGGEGQRAAADRSWRNIRVPRASSTR
jgi:hypothetical protein